MAKGTKQKQKLLYLAKLFNEHTDEDHGLTMKDIISMLNSNDINADRKTIYQDLEELRNFGLDIISEQKNKNVYYRLASRDFELPELKLLVDSVQSAKFITEKKSRELIGKLESLVSRYEARQLQRQVIISGRVKTMNESIYYSVDKIHTAINEDAQISFQYFQWNVSKEPELRHDGKLYVVSPWSLVWDDEYYYLIAYDAQSGIMKHYRVDKMLNISVLEDRRDGKDLFSNIDLPKYSKSLFGMYGGEEITVTLLCEKNMAAPIIDRFGKDISIIKTDDEHFKTYVTVTNSRQFLGWIFALGGGVKITAPDTMVEEMKKEAKRLSEQYL